MLHTVGFHPDLGNRLESVTKQDMEILNLKRHLGQGPAPSLLRSQGASHTHPACPSPPPPAAEGSPGVSLGKPHQRAAPDHGWAWTLPPKLRLMLVGSRIPGPGRHPVPGTEVLLYASLLLPLIQTVRPLGEEDGRLSMSFPGSTRERSMGRFGSLVLDPSGCVPAMQLLE